EMVRMVSSGTEATMSAIRLARGYTGRDTIIKFEGCYHGHSDSLLVKAGSGALTFGVPSSPGVPAARSEEHTSELQSRENLVCRRPPSSSAFPYTTLFRSEMVRMVSSGTEATMSAIRLARGYTGRDTIIKFEGCYHGHSDSLLVKAGSGALTFGVPSSPGVPAA